MRKELEIVFNYLIRNLPFQRFCNFTHDIWNPLYSLFYLKCPPLHYCQCLEIQLLKQRALPLVPDLRPDSPYIRKCNEIQEIEPFNISRLFRKIYYEPFVMEVSVLRSVGKDKVVLYQKFYNRSIVFREAEPAAYPRNKLSALFRMPFPHGLSYIMKKHGERQEFRPFYLFY